MDDEDGRCLLDVICDPEALNDFLHGSETHGHVPEIPPPSQLSASGPPVLPSSSVDLDFLEDDDILGGSPGGGPTGAGDGFVGDHEPCDILQQSLAEANITEQSLQEAQLDLGSFELTGLTQVVPALADPGSLAVATEPTVGLGIGVGGQSQIFTGPVASSAVQPATDMLGSVLAHPSLQLQPQVVNKAIGVQPFVQQVGLGNVTLQPISGLQALPNGSPSGHLGIGQIQVVGQPAVMTINQPMQPILAKTVGGYQLHQAGAEMGVASTQATLGGQVLSSTGGLLIQGGKPAVEQTALNGTAVAVSAAGGNGATVSGFSGSPVGTAVGAQPQAQAQGQILQNVIIQRTPTPIQPKPPQGGALQPKLFKQPHQQQALPAIQSEAKVLGVQQGAVPVSSAQNVAFLSGKAGTNVVLSTPAPAQGAAYPQALFKQQAPQPAGKQVSVHVLNQPGSIVIPSQTLLQGQNSQFLLPQLQAGGQILTQHAGGHILTSQGPGGQLIANQILTTNQNLNLSQVLTQQGHSAHIISGPIQLQPGQVTQPTLFQMPVAQGHAQVIQSMPIQSPLTMLGQVEALGPTVSLQPPAQQAACGLLAPAGVAPCQPGEGITVLGGTVEQAPNLVQAPPSVVTVQTGPPVTVSSAVASPSPCTASSSLASLPPPSAQQSPGSLFLSPQGPSMILSQESLQMFLQQFPSAGPQQHLKIQNASPSQTMPAHPTPPSLSDSPQASQASPLVLGQQVQPPSQPPSRSCTPSSLQPLFIIHNQPTDSPQHAAPPHSQAPAAAPSQPASFSQDTPPASCSPKPLQGTPVQFQLAPPASCSPKPSQATPVQFQLAPPAVAQQAPLQGLTSEQQQTLQLIGAQLQTLSSIAQPSVQQKQLLDKLHQVQQSIILQSKPQTQLQPLPANQLGVKQEAPPPQAVTLSGGQGTPTQLVPVLQQASVLVNAPVSVSNEVKVFLGGPPVGAATATSLAQPLQPKQGVIGSVGGLSLDKGRLRIQVCGGGLTQLTAQQALPAVQTQGAAKMPLVMEPSKEARMLEQLRKQQGSVLHPDCSSPFCSFEDTLHQLLPYHLYQGTSSSLEDYRKVDEEFENVSGQLLKRTQAMLDKYRLLLFEEAKRLGPSAEMVMIDRMFIQEEKVALNQDRVLAKERPDEYVAQMDSASSSKQQPPLDEPAPAHPKPAPAGVAAITPTSFPAATHLTPTRMVIKQGGGTTSVTWSSSITSGPMAPPRSSVAADDEDALPQRSSKPPIKTYEARRRIGLKLKIKQEAGLSKVVHNTALDPVHTPTQAHSQPSPKQHRLSGSARTPPTMDIVSPSITVASTASSPSQQAVASSSSSPQMNGTLEHRANALKSPDTNETPPQITCRLPLRKTYRENVSPRRRPGVLGGGAGISSPLQPPASLAPPPESQSSSPSADRTVIASVKLERRGGRSSTAWVETEPGVGVSGDAQERGPSPGLMKELAEVEEVFYRGMIKNAHHHRSEDGDNEDDEDDRRKEELVGKGRSRQDRRKSRDRGGGPTRTDRQVPGSSSPLTEHSCPWDSSLPTKRRRSGSPDVDNASFSSGSPPPDDSLKEHLQRAIDGILNLQQGGTRGPGARANLSQRLGGPPSGSLSASQRSPLGGADGHGHNGKLISRTSSR